MQKYFHLFLDFIACKRKYLNTTRAGIRSNFISLNCINETMKAATQQQQFQWWHMHQEV